MTSLGLKKNYNQFNQQQTNIGNIYQHNKGF